MLIVVFMCFACQARSRGIQPAASASACSSAGPSWKKGLAAAILRGKILHVYSGLEMHSSILCLFVAVGEVT